MRKIVLTKGLIALIDDEDWKLVKDVKFRASDSGGKYYAKGRFKGSDEYLHRIVMGVIGDFCYIDHINGDTLDCRKANLRPCLPRENGKNLKKKGGTYKGVFWHKRDKFWYAKITVDGKQKWLGRFSNAPLAAEAYDNAAKKYFGEFAQLNFPKKGLTEKV